MGTIANIVINDGASTPVAHTFEPSGRDANGIVTYQDKSSGVALAFPTVTLKIRLANKNQPVTKVTGKISYPVLSAVSGANINGYTPAASVSHTLSGDFSFTLPQLSSQTERDNLIAYMVNLLAHSFVQSMVISYVDQY